MYLQPFYKIKNLVQVNVVKKIKKLKNSRWVLQYYNKVKDYLHINY
jgi:hypothetical protein